MTDYLDAVVVGAGVVGLAIARRLALAGMEVIILECNDAIGEETSSRNSEVIHAGIYYATDSLKARLCVAGKWQLYDHCASHGVPHERCGKLIVATSAAELQTLEGIKEQAAVNGVDDLYWLSAAEVKAMEPALSSVGALMSPSTGIIDSHGLMLSYQGDAEDHGAMVALQSKLVGGEISNQGFKLRVQMADGEEMEIFSRRLINAAGLGAQDTALALSGLDHDLVPPRYLCKGSYFTMTGKQPFSHLIYPVPDSASLGVHVTIDLAGCTRFGPDQEWVDDLDYDVEPDRAQVFYAAVRKYFPGLQDGQLQPAYAGIRPKIQAPDAPGRDFMLQGAGQHGIAGLVNLFGMESPGLTASLAIADEVFDQLA